MRRDSQRNFWRSNRREINPPPEQDAAGLCGDSRPRLSAGRSPAVLQLWGGSSPRTPPSKVTKVSLASCKSAGGDGGVRIAARQRDPMAVAKLKRTKEDRFEDLAERIAAE